LTPGIAGTCADKHLNRELVRRAKEAILHRVRNLMAKTIKEIVGHALKLHEAGCGFRDCQPSARTGKRNFRCLGERHSLQSALNAPPVTMQ
jgi:hypothetical protein